MTRVWSQLDPGFLPLVINFCSNVFQNKVTWGFTRSKKVFVYIYTANSLLFRFCSDSEMVKRSDRSDRQAKTWFHLCLWDFLTKCRKTRSSNTLKTKTSNTDKQKHLEVKYSNIYLCNLLHFSKTAKTGCTVFANTADKLIAPTTALRQNKVCPGGDQQLKKLNLYFQHC